MKATAGGPARATLPQSPSNMRGIASMLVAMFCFVTNDMFIKLTSEFFGAAQTTFLRGVMASILVIVLAAATGALTPVPRKGWTALSLRSLGETGGALLLIAALFHMPFANVMAVLQGLPLVMTIVSAVVFGELVRRRRWAAIIVGFIGMLLVVRPAGEGFTIYSIIAVVGLGFLALRDSASRFLPSNVTSLFAATLAAITVTIAAGIWAMSEPWTPVTIQPLIYIACSASFLVAGLFFITEAMRHGDVSVVTPFFYSMILWALIYALLIWGDVPDATALFGIALIVGSGLYVLHREAGTGAKPRRSATTPTEST